MSRDRAAVVGLALAVASWCVRDSAAAEDAVDPADAALVASLADPSKRDAAQQQLVARGAAAVPALVAGLGDAKLREPVLAVVTTLGPVAKDAVSAVGGVVRLQRSPARPAAARALAAIGADAAPMLNSLVVYVGDERATGREDAAAAIATILVAQARRMPRSVARVPVDDAIAAGCDWLLRHQRDDGGWSSTKFEERCAAAPHCAGPGEAEYDVGVSGLATMALARTTSHAASDATRAGAAKGIAFLRSRQGEAGFLVPSGVTMHWIYNHMCGTLALVDALGKGGDDGVRAAATAAVKVVVDAQNPYLGWRYGMRDTQNDTSVTAWGAEVLAAARDVGIAVPAEGLDWAASWVDKMSDPGTSRVGYQTRGGASARTNETMERFPGDRSEAMTACGVIIRVLAGQTRHEEPFVKTGIDRLARRRPKWDRASGEIDFYYWLHGSWLMSRVPGSDYVEWRRALIDALGAGQVTTAAACARGSWDAADPWSAEGGRVYATSACILSLEACAEDPATRPVLPSGQKSVVAALERVVASKDEPKVRRAAGGALDAVRSAYR